ncbi:MAG: SPOR domain-containing protein [Steroidobacteraceae bacterium]
MKERLVGAAVLVAVAVILIPEMLSGPSDRKAEGSAGDSAAEEGGVRTYTIDLGDRARSGANEAVAPATATAAAVEETPAPPPEIVPEAGVPSNAPVPEKEPASSAPVVAAAAEPRPEERPAAVAKSSQTSSPPPVPAQAAPTPARSSGGQGQPWVVQIGSFAKQATAEKLSQDLKRRGYASFVVPFKPGAQTLYRVRVGPMKERGDADAVVQKLKREGTAATVVANG